MHAAPGHDVSSMRCVAPGTVLAGGHSPKPPISQESVPAPVSPVAINGARVSPVSFLRTAGAIPGRLVGAGPLVGVRLTQVIRGIWDQARLEEALRHSRPHDRDRLDMNGEGDAFGVELPRVALYRAQETYRSVEAPR